METNLGKETESEDLVKNQKIIAEVAQLVEHNLAKVRVAGSSPVFRSNERPKVNFGAFFYDNASLVPNFNFPLLSHLQSIVQLLERQGQQGISAIVSPSPVSFY